MSIVRVIGGVDSHADVHVAAAIDSNGAMLGIESFGADEVGYQDLLGWLASFGAVTLVGVEGTGSWGGRPVEVSPQPRGRHGGGGSTQPPDPPQEGKVGSDRCGSGGSSRPVGRSVGDPQGS